MTRPYISYALVLVALLPLAASGQFYVNKEWVRQTGLPDALDWSASVLDPIGNIIIVGNTMVQPNDPDILITKYDKEGNMLWEQHYAGPASAQDYGVGVVADQNGTLYVSGVITTTSGFLDVVLLKYTSTGGLVWSQTWSGGTGLADVVTSMVLDEDGSIYLAGSSYSTPADPDYLVLKYAASGLLLWSATYDHAGLIDAATGITLSNEGYPLVTGVRPPQGMLGITQRSSSTR